MLDLPVDSASGAHKFLLGDGRDVTIEAGSNMILFKKEIRVVEVALRHDFMVTHRYTREDDYGRQIRSDDDEAVPEEFLMNTPYRCEVIMTNVSPERKNFSLLY